MRSIFIHHLICSHTTCQFQVVYNGVFNIFIAFGIVYLGKGIDYIYKPFVCVLIHIYDSTRFLNLLSMFVGKEVRDV